MKKPKLSELTLREKIGQTGVAYPAIDLEKENLPFGTAWSVGGLRMAFVNMDFTPRDDLVMKADEYIERMKKVNEKQKIPMISAMDCMFGIKGAFYEFEPLIAPPLIGAANDIDLAYESGKLRGRQLKRAGARWMWGPEVDLVSRESKISYGRLYSDDSERMTKMAIAEMKGCQSVGVAATAKHFPGADGMEFRDPHTSFQMIHLSTDEWWEKQGKIYQTLFDEGICSVMMSHMSFPAYDDTKINGRYVSSSASKKIITDLVKGKMGFKGVVITDAVKMLGLYSIYGSLERVYVECLKAGNDAILGVDANYIDVIEKAVLSGEISEERINDACERILEMKEKIGLFDDEEKPESIEVINADTRELAKIISEKGVTTEANTDNLLPLDKASIKSVGIVAISPDVNIVKQLEEGIGASFEKRGIKTTIRRNLYSYDDIDNLVEENDLIIYVAARMGKYKYFGMEERESYNFVMHTGAEKSMGLSLFDPYVYFDEFSVLNTYINAYSFTDYTQETAVKMILGELPLRNTGAFNIVPKEFRKYESIGG